ncbi:MAG TPA: FtsK/SpoIIIE domain-containing protein [Mycobacteriales bacterium]
MQVRVTIVPADGTPVDVDVRCPPGTRLADLRTRLPEVAGLDAAMPLHHGRTPLGGDAVVGLPPLVEGVVLTAAPRCGTAVTGPRQLRATGGPDAGVVFTLAPGRLLLGRDPTVHLPLADPDLSRRHALLTVTADGVRVRDNGSTNGTVLDGVELAGADRPLPPGVELRCGSTTLVYTEPADPPAVVRPDGSGGVAVHRAPRMAPPPAVREVVVPDATATGGARRWSWAPFLLAPVLLGGVLWATTGGSPAYLLMAVLSPVLWGVTAVAQGAGGRRERTRRTERAAAVARRDTLLAEEVARRRSEAPDPATVLEIASTPGHRVWERRPGDPDWLDLRIGLAPRPARLAVRHGTGAPAHPTLSPVPVVVPLRTAGVLGLVGERPLRARVFRWLVGQLAALHGPHDLQLVLLVEDPAPDDWSWAQWLPQLRCTGPAPARARLGIGPAAVTSRLAELAAEADRRTARGRPWSGPATVLLVDERLPGADAGLSALLSTGPPVGIYAVCTATASTELPAACGAVVSVTDPAGTRARVSVAGEQPTPEVVLDGVGPSWADAVARGLAPLRDTAPDDGAGLPDSVRLLDLVALGSPADVAARWRARPRGTSTVLGVARDGPVTVDLVRDGPHALVAGTTGAGKSELLQTLVAGLAAANSPEDLSILLVDYKGGAAFGECVRLPHTVGLVTDLDGHQTARALESLAAELRRRERLLAEVGAADLTAYAERRDAGEASAPLGRLLLVVDEFASLVTDLPEFVPGLVDIARRGRSLGVHLVLATQRPAGVVSAEVRANTALRIALRMTDDAESLDVVGASDAARLPAGRPGRACARRAGGELTVFQTARIAGRPPVTTHRPTEVRAVPWTSLGTSTAEEPEVAPGARTDLADLVDTVRAAADLAGLLPAPSPWLPPLPAVVGLDEVDPDGALPPSAVPLGLTDRPGEQRRAPFGLDLAAGRHLLVAGGPRSGRTTALHTLAGAVARHHPPQDVHVYVLDCGGGHLRPVERLPHCGAVADRTDVDRGERLLDRLAAEVRARRAFLAEHGHASAAEQRSAGVGTPLPWILLLLDSWEGFVQSYERVDHGRYVDAVVQLLREGPSAGLTAVLTGERTLLTSRAATLIRDRLILRPADPSDCALAGLPTRGLPTRALPTETGPGRALLAEEAGAVEVQLAVLGTDPSGAAQAAELARLAARSPTDRHEPNASRPLLIRALPPRICLRDLALPDSPAARLWTPLGVGGDDAEPVGVDLTGGGLLIAGPPGSGRTTALAAVASWATARGTTVVIVAPPRSPLTRCGHGTVLAPADGEALRRFLGPDGGGPRMIVVDDAELLLDSPADSALAAHLAGAEDPGTAIVAAGGTAELLATFRGLTIPLRRARLGVLLCPSGPLDGDLLGVRLRRGAPTLPGRGVFVHDGQTTTIQVAQP